MSGRGRGRGAYYKAKYGGEKRTRDTYDDHPTEAASATDARLFTAHDPSGGSISDWTRLSEDLEAIDGQQYGDAYAAPSRVRVVMPWSETGFPDLYLQTDIRRIALADMVTRYAAAYITAQHFNNNVGEANGGWSGPKGGAFNINAPGQEVLPRTSAVISGHETTELRFTVALPAKGRTIMGLQARQILVTNLPKVVKMALLYANVDHTALRPHATSVENQHHLRNELRSRNMVAFVANGSMLARASGPSALPMKGQDAVTFRSPPELEVSMQLEDGTEVSGMAIPRGITLLTGGGFHGKSTLLEALQLGVYDHVPGDGRELIVTDPTAVKVRAEDGRFVAGVDISPFMSELPGGKDTKSFSTGDASGSTSMAASIQEALEMGCTTLMIDEDSSATNLLVRDQRMQSLIKREPITLLVSKVRALYEVYGVSTIIVVGGLGDWLSVADNVILMEAYRPNMVNIQAQAVVKRYPSMVAQDEVYGSFPNRMIRLRYPDGLKGNRGPQAQTMSFITIRPAVEDPVANPAKDADGIDLSGLEQIVEVGQTRTIAGFVHRLADGAAPEGREVQSLLREMEQEISLDRCMPASMLGGDFDAPRRFELAAAMSRFRGLVVHAKDNTSSFEDD